eukprot:CAMPEP_0119134326 /NCGR_PEP_ID=MMETSP1310-20130426/16480_1 /TAXON_ID=464262 /ORGANISM="Genus nov. species nov., Strain RCC2339" /LENGTH=205 /DNA_ID=CAMNT_0007125109 /DNA_START=136 /DNA_END=750 /DNA_ORIENTATION=+
MKLWSVNNSHFSKNGHGSVAVLSWFLGFWFCAGLWIAVHYEGLRAFGLYVSLLSVFHMSEWLVTATYNAKEVSADSFLLNHSREYGIACAGAFTEYFVEYFLYPDMKQLWFIMYPGLIISVVGIVLRVVGMCTAGAAFTHQIKDGKRQEHHLITDGVYSHIRHPGYCGWFWWTVASQILLMNPLCTVAFSIVSWKFFADRIPFEE